MGAGESKTSFEPNSNRNSRRRTRSLSGLDDLEDIEIYLKTIDSDVRTFNGLREDLRYAQYQKTLAGFAQRLTSMRSSVKRNKQQKCDRLRRDIQNLVLTLEDKVKSNEDNLDVATVESNSFIGHNVNKKRNNNNRSFDEDNEGNDDVFAGGQDVRKSKKDKNISEKTEKRNQQIEELQKRFGAEENRRSTKSKTANWQRDPKINSMNTIKDNARKLEIDLQNAITLQENRLFTVLEKKILILFTDLEMIRVEKYPELQQRKDDISEILIQLNNKTKKAKQNMNKSPQAQTRDTLKSNKVTASGKKAEDMFRIADDVDILEMRANSLQGTKQSDDYKSVKQSANKHWAKLEEMATADEKAHKYKQQIKERIKALLQILNERANQNEKIIQAELNELEIIKSELAKLQGFVEEFNDNTKSEKYDFIDQNLRKLWANLTKVKESTEEVTNNKKSIIENIQDALKKLSEKATSKEPVYAQIVHKNKKSKTTDVIGELKQLTNLLKRQSNYMSNPDLTSMEKDELANTLQFIEEAVKEQLQTLKKSKETSKNNDAKPGESRNSVYNQAYEPVTFKNTSTASLFSDSKTSSTYTPVYTNADVNNTSIGNTTSTNKLSTTHATTDGNISSKVSALPNGSLPGYSSIYKSSTGVNSSSTSKFGETTRFDFTRNDGSTATNRASTASSSITDRVETRASILKNENRQSIISDARKSFMENNNHRKSYVEEGRTSFIQSNDIPTQLPPQEPVQIRKPIQQNEKQEHDNIHLQKISHSIKIQNGQNQDMPNTIINQLPKSILGEELDVINSYNRSVERTSKTSMDEMMKIDATVQNLKKQISMYQSTKKDKEYSDIEDALMESVITLNVVETMGLDNLKIAKDEIMKQIRDLQAELPRKLKENEARNNGSSTQAIELKQLIEQCQTWKKKVDCFSGMYKSVQYNQIEDGLRLNLQKLNDFECANNEKLAKARNQTIEKVEQYLKILDEKSLKAEQRPMNRASVSYGKLEVLRNDLVKVKSEIEAFHGQYKDPDYERILKNLNKSALDLENIDDYGSESMKTSINQYRSYIDQLTTYFEEKLELSQ